MNYLSRALLPALLAGMFFTAGANAGSPYMANGIGYQAATDNGPARGMGGAGLANPNGLNLLTGNPALLAGTAKSTLLFGASNNLTRTTIDGAGTESFSRTDMDLLMFALPVTRGIVVGWNLSPYSRTDGSMILSRVENGTAIDDDANITGGISTSHAGIAWGWRDRIRVGYSMNYHFGAIQEEWTRRFPNNPELVPSLYYLKRKYSGYSHSIGMVASFGPYLSVGAGYTTPATLDRKDYVVIGSLANDDLLQGKGTSKLPESIQFGLYSNPSGTLGMALDTAFERWEDATVTQTERDQYANTFRVAAGIRYQQSTRDTDPYYRKIPLSAGVRYRTLYYRSSAPSADTVSERAFTLGAEFPLKNEVGYLVTSLEAGTRGDQQTNGWHDTFVGFNIALIGSLH